MPSAPLDWRGNLRLQHISHVYGLHQAADSFLLISLLLSWLRVCRALFCLQLLLVFLCGDRRPTFFCFRTSPCTRGSMTFADTAPLITLAPFSRQL